MTSIELRSASVRLEAVSVHFEPGAFQRWRGVHGFSAPYARIAGLTMTEPQGLARGRLIVRLVDDGDACAVSFGAFRLREMRRIYAEIWRRSQAAKGDRAR